MKKEQSRSAGIDLGSKPYWTYIVTIIGDQRFTVGDIVHRALKDLGPENRTEINNITSRVPELEGLGYLRSERGRFYLTEKARDQMEKYRLSSVRADLFSLTNRGEQNLGYLVRYMKGERSGELISNCQFIG